MKMTKQQRVDLTEQGWSVYPKTNEFDAFRDLYTIPLYADEIQDFNELADALRVIPTVTDEGIQMFTVLIIATKGEE